MNKNDTKTKQLVCVLLAASSFIVILLFCMRLQARGLPIIACLAVHTICMFILWKDALNQAESDDDDTFNWASPSEQKNTLPVLESSEQKPSAAVSETDIAEGEAVPAETDKQEKATISDEAVEQESEAASEESSEQETETIPEETREQESETVPEENKEQESEAVPEEASKQETDAVYDKASEEESKAASDENMLLEDIITDISEQETEAHEESASDPYVQEFIPLGGFDNKTEEITPKYISFEEEHTVKKDNVFFEMPPVENQESLFKTCELPIMKEAEVTPVEEEPKEEPASPETDLLFSVPEELTDIDIISAAKDITDGMRSFAAQHEIKLHLSTTCENVFIKADRESVRTLFYNIIDNSIKYMGRPGHMIITISLLGEDIFLIMKDTGLGLSKEETAHIFEPYFQGSNRIGGNGKGLAQVKSIVEAFGGTIYAKSNPDNGMAIFIQLPVSEASAS